MTLANGDISANIVRENVNGQTSLVFRQTDFLNFLAAKGRIKVNPGASPFAWNVNYTGNSTAEVYAEGQAFTSSGTQLRVRASVSAFYMRIYCGVTGHVRDQVNRGGTYDDALKEELDKGIADFLVSFEAQLVGSTQDRGLASIIDSGDTYAGLAPGTYSAWVSQETAVGGALTLGVMETMYETAITTPRGAMPTDFLCRENQINNYLSTVGASAGTTSTIARVLLDGKPTDYGQLVQGCAYNEVPFTMIRSMVNTELYLLDLGATPDEFMLVDHRPIQVDAKSKTSDNDEMVVSRASMLVVKNRRKQSKLTGVTA